MQATGIRPVTDMFDRISGSTPNIWRKFIGEQVPDGTPDLIDHSYAGYKNGEESIPVATGIIYDVTDYGAVPNDNESDTQAIRDTLSAASSNGIVFFPPGQYDILLNGESISKFIIGRSGGPGNITIRGSGAQGADRNGTTIKMHGHLEGHWECLFEPRWQHNGKNRKTQISGTFPRGTKHFDVVDSSSLIGKKFVIITASGLFDEDWAEHSSRAKNELSDWYSNIHRNGIIINETHEIDRIEGNRVFIKAPTTTPLNLNYFVYWKNLQEGIGFEDIHFDGNLQEDYVHLQQPGRNWITLNHTAHSWVQRCRFSNSIIGVWISGYANSVIGIIFDGRRGHYPSVLASATYCFIGLLEDHTDNGMSHGISLANRSTGNVAWGIGGPSIDGPDGHGEHPRNTLFDNYYSRTHHSSSGKGSSMPHHLDGYTRWNNIIDYSFRENRTTIDLWQPSGNNRFLVTQSNLIGYIQSSGNSPLDAYVEYFGNSVYPLSLYEAQLERRLGYLPQWVDDSKEMYNEFFGKIFGGDLPTPLEGRKIGDIGFIYMFWRMADIFTAKRICHKKCPIPKLIRMKRINCKRDPILACYTQLTGFVARGPRASQC